MAVAHFACGPAALRYQLMISDLLGLNQARSFAGIGNHPRRGAHRQESAGELPAERFPKISLDK